MDKKDHAPVLVSLQTLKSDPHADADAAGSSYSVATEQVLPMYKSVPAVQACGLPGTDHMGGGWVFSRAGGPLAKSQSGVLLVKLPPMAAATAFRLVLSVGEKFPHIGLLVRVYIYIDMIRNSRR